MSGLCREETGDEVLKHRPAVLLAKNRVVKVMPTKAADEEPEGNDFRPSRISLAFLCFVNNYSIESSPHTNPVHVRAIGSH